MLLFILIDGIIVCLSYWKSGVISFFQDIEQKSGSYIVFPGFILKKVGLCDFSGSYSKKNGDIYGYPGDKKWSYRFFCVYSK